MVILKIKKSYTDLYPDPSEKTYKNMKDDIEKHGQIIPIYHNKKGHILDGYTRYRIVNELNLKPLTELKEFSSKVEELEFIVSMNSQRRDLTVAQKFLVFEDYRQILLKLNKAHKHSSNSKKPSPHGQSKLVIAKKAGISTISAERMIYVINNGTADDVKKLKDGASLWSIHIKVKNKQKKIIDDAIAEKEKELEKIEREIAEKNLSTNNTPDKQLVPCPECGGSGKILI